MEETAARPAAKNLLDWGQSIPPTASPAAACPLSDSQQRQTLAIRLRLLAVKMRQKAGVMNQTWCSEQTEDIYIEGDIRKMYN